MQVTTAMVAVLTSSQRIDLNPVCNCDSLALMMAIFPPKVVAVDEAGSNFYPGAHFNHTIDWNVIINGRVGRVLVQEDEDQILPEWQADITAWG